MILDIIERIDRKKQELSEIFRPLPDNQFTVAYNLICEAAFMAVTLEDLKSEMCETGTAETYRHGGGQTGTKQGTAVKNYLSMIGKYTAIMDKLIKMIPKGGKAAYTTPERYIDQMMEKASENQRLTDEQRAFDEAFLNAVATNEIKQTEINKFREKWRTEHLV